MQPLEPTARRYRLTRPGRLSPRAAHLRLATLLAVLATVLLAAGCSKLTFIRQDRGRGDFVRTAPDLNIQTDPLESGAAKAKLAIRRGQRYLTAGDLQHAADAADEALELDPDSAAAHTLAALVAGRSGKAEQAGQHYRKAVELAPAMGGMLNNYGTWLCHNGRPADSLQWFDQALTDRSYATPAVAMANAGVCAADAGLSERSGLYLQVALELDPENPLALEAMAEREFRAGRAFHARAFSQRRLAAAQPTAKALWLASQIETKLGDTEAAARYVQRMKTEFPEAADSGSGDDGRQ